MATINISKKSTSPSSITNNDKNINNDNNNDASVTQESQDLHAQDCQDSSQQLTKVIRDHARYRVRAVGDLYKQAQILDMLAKEEEDLRTDMSVSQRCSREDTETSRDLLASLQKFEDNLHAKEELACRLQEVNTLMGQVDKEIKDCRQRLIKKKDQGRGKNRFVFPRRHDEAEIKEERVSRKYSIVIKEIEALRQQADDLNCVRNIHVKDLNQLVKEVKELSAHILALSKEDTSLLKTRHRQDRDRSHLAEMERIYCLDMNLVETNLKNLKTVQQFMYIKQRRRLLPQTGNVLKIPKPPGKRFLTQTKERQEAVKKASVKMGIIKKAFSSQLAEAQKKRIAEEAARKAKEETRHLLTPGEGPSRRRSQYRPARRSVIVIAPVKEEGGLQAVGVSQKVAQGEDTAATAVAAAAVAATAPVRPITVMHPDDVEMIQNTFRKMVTTNDDLRYLLIEKLEQIVQVKQERFKVQKEIETQAAQNLPLARSQELKNKLDKTTKRALEAEAEAGIADDVIKDYCGAVQGLLQKLDLPPEKLKTVYGRHQTVNLENVLDCLGLIEIYVNQLDLQQKVQELKAGDKVSGVVPPEPSVSPVNSDFNLQHSMAVLSFTSFPDESTDGESGKKM